MLEHDTKLFIKGYLIFFVKTQLSDRAEYTINWMNVSSRTSITRSLTRWQLRGPLPRVQGEKEKPGTSKRWAEKLWNSWLCSILQGRHRHLWCNFVWCVCTFVYVCTYEDMCVCIYMHVYMCACAYMYTPVRICVCIYVCVMCLSFILVNEYCLFTWWTSISNDCRCAL